MHVQAWLSTSAPKKLNPADDKELNDAKDTTLDTERPAFG